MIASLADRRFGATANRSELRLFRTWFGGCILCRTAVCVIPDWRKVLIDVSFHRVFNLR